MVHDPRSVNFGDVPRPFRSWRARGTRAWRRPWGRRTPALSAAAAVWTMH